MPREEQLRQWKSLKKQWLLDEVGTMSKSTANTLLQYLVAELTRLWRGEKSGIKTAEQAYEICAEIVKEAEENEQNAICR